jgi:hypothetical protein
MAQARLDAVIRHVRGFADSGSSACPSDGELIHAFVAEDDQTAFATIVRRHGPMVLAVGRRVLLDIQDAEDAFQATFLLLARKASSLRKEGSLAGWLHGVVYRMAGHARRAALRRRQHEGRARVMHTPGPEWEVYGARYRKFSTRRSRGCRQSTGKPLCFVVWRTRTRSK